MPQYQYRCPNDNATITLGRAIDQRDDRVECPECKQDMRREITPAAIQFKGTGFYKTGG